MTLATLFLLASFVAFAPALGAQTEQSSDAAPASKSAPQSQEAPSAPQNPAATQQTSPQTPPASHTSSTAKRKNQKKKVTTSPCSVSSPGPAATNSNSQSPAPGSTSNASAQASDTAPSKDCPPPKIIVRHGGTKDPSIQLAGAPKADQSAQKRDTINQLLGVTDQNLKKTAGMQLSPDQQDTVTQTRQFIDQSKAAMAEGDLERARTLAWKAELLSEDLVNPEK